MSEFQSNSPFPTSNFHPRPPLVRYGYPPVFHSPFPTSNINSPSPLVQQRFPPVFPTMSPQESRIIWCLVEGDSNPYDIFDIPIEANVNRLKAAIKERIERLHNINPDGLKLRKVVSLIPGACAF
jgi:Crinkler effector protein N-terminal domain